MKLPILNPRLLLGLIPSAHVLIIGYSDGAVNNYLLRGFCVVRCQYPQYPHWYARNRRPALRLVWARCRCWLLTWMMRASRIASPASKYLTLLHIIKRLRRFVTPYRRPVLCFLILPGHLGRAGQIRVDVALAYK